MKERDGTRWNGELNVPNHFCPALRGLFEGKATEERLADIGAEQPAALLYSDRINDSLAPSARGAGRSGKL